MKVDIIIPAFHGVYLKDAIDSCLNQTYKNYQITVVDDCSPNHNVKKICDLYPKVRYLRTEANLGPAGARNFGIKNTSFEIISFLDEDDIMEQNKLFYSIEEFKKDSSIGMTCGNYRVLLNGKLKPQFYKRAIQIEYKNLLRTNFVATGSVSIKRDILNTVGYFNEEYWIGEDYDLWLRCSELYPIKYIHKVLYFYRVIPQGNSLTQREDIQRKHLENITKIRKESIERVKIQK